jgi:hypothetical protein
MMENFGFWIGGIPQKVVKEIGMDSTLRWRTTGGCGGRI